MILESVSFKDWASLVNQTGMGKILASLVIEQRNKVSMFTQIPNLVDSRFVVEAGAGDEVEIYNMTAAKGVGIPGEYQANRQLSGNEAMVDFNFAKDKVTVGLHRYAVALRNHTDAHFLPKQMIQYLMGTISAWWIDQSDDDVFTTLFRDYPAYYAETATVDPTQGERVLALFGRGPRNDIGSSVYHYYPNGKTDIEELTDEDTLSDVFLRKLNSFCQNFMSMNPISMEDSLANYGLIVDQSDINFLRANSSESLEDKIKTAFQGQGWDSPVFKNVIMDLEGIRLFKWDPIAVNDNMHAVEPSMSSYKGLRGTAIYPMAKILSAAAAGETVTGLKVWGAGDLDIVRGIPTVGEDADGHFLLVSNGAKHFPFYTESGSNVIGKDSINKFAVTATEAALDSCNMDTGDLVGRMQIGNGSHPLTRFKVLYTGPTYVGALQVGTPFSGKKTFVEDVYKVRIQAIAKWDPTANDGDGAFEDLISVDAEIDGDLIAWDVLKAFLAIDPATKVVNQGAAYNNFQYDQNQRMHMFDVVRSIAFGSNIIHEVFAGKELTLSTENRDYNAIEGTGLTAVAGKKLATNTQGRVNGYIVVPFKRPTNLL